MGVGGIIVRDVVILVRVIFLLVSIASVLAWVNLKQSITMEIRIPREILWHDKETMDDMLQSPLFKALHEAFICCGREPLLFPMNELTILNEVGYQVTWLCYMSRFKLSPNMEQFTREVFANTGLKDHAMMVISLVYAAVELVNFPPLRISKYAKRELKLMHKNSWCRRYVDAFVKKVIRDGELYDERFIPNQVELDDFLKASVSEEEQKVPMCAEPMAEYDTGAKGRSFTLEEIINYCKNLAELEQVNAINAIIQMLYVLLRMNGKPAEYDLIDGILNYFKKRKYGDAVSGNKNSVGDNSNMVNFVLPPKADYDKLFAALPEEIKDIWSKQLMQKDNG